MSAQKEPTETTFADEFVESRHFLQSAPWAALQRKRGNAVIERSGPGWEYLAIVEHGKVARRLYCPYGPTVADADADALEEALEDLRQQAKELKVDFVRVEPRVHFSSEFFEELGLTRSHHDVQPPDTIVSLVDADRVSADEVVASASGNSRRNWRKAGREGITYRVSHDPSELSHFLAMIHEVAERTGMHPHADGYFQDIADTLFPEKNAGLMFAELDGQPIASLIFYTDGVTMSYAHAASFSEHRKISPATGLLLQSMLHAHETGHSFYDTYGVAPVDAPDDHPWQGFTKFKKGFGGEHVSYPGTWEIPVRKVKYELYTRAARILEQQTP